MATRRFLNGQGLVQAQQERFARKRLTRDRALRDMATMGLADALELTSGSLSPAQTKGAFARGLAPGSGQRGRRPLSARERRARGLPGTVPLLPINIQSGKLHKSFRLIPTTYQGHPSLQLVSRGGGGGVWTLMQGGTSKMVDRGFIQEMKRRRKARQQAFVQYYIRAGRP